VKGHWRYISGHLNRFYVWRSTSILSADPKGLGLLLLVVFELDVQAVLDAHLHLDRGVLGWRLYTRLVYKDITKKVVGKSDWLPEAAENDV
jgi:hypothetical protein